MNYEIIKDKNLFLKFIDFLPKLENGECFYIQALARRKYWPELPRDVVALKRFTVTNKDWLFDKVKQLECELGSYKSNGVGIDSSALCLYIMPNPRSLEQAAKKTLIKLAELITKPYANYNPHQECLSMIQQSCSRKIFFDLDMDTKQSPQDFLLFAEPHVNRNALTIVKTKNGFHVLVEVAKIEQPFVKTWYKNLTKFEGCDITGDCLLNMVGCVQGTTFPTFYDSHSS